MWAGNTQLLLGCAKVCAWLLAHFFMDGDEEDKKLSDREIHIGQEPSIHFLQARLEEGLKGMDHRHQGLCGKTDVESRSNSSLPSCPNWRTIMNPLWHLSKDPLSTLNFYLWVTVVLCLYQVPSSCVQQCPASLSPLTCLQPWYSVLAKVIAGLGTSQILKVKLHFFPGQSS